MANFIGLDPNGTWELRMHDDTAFDDGTVSGGWTLRIDAKANTAPVANNDVYTINEDTTLTTTTGSAPLGS
jgi:Bacterial cadherin-like domain